MDASRGNEFSSFPKTKIICSIVLSISPLPSNYLSIIISNPLPGERGGRVLLEAFAAPKGMVFFRYFGLKMGIDCNHFSHSLNTGINFTETGIDSRGQG